jgi:hypothetical protein
VTSPLPPKRRDSRNLADLIRQDRTRLTQLDRGLVGGKFPPARPLKRPFDDGGEDDDDFEPILFSNTDVAVCPSNGSAITLVLSHVPEGGSEQVYYNGTPLKRTDWYYLTPSRIVIPAEPWFRAKKVAWVDYAYYDIEIDPEPAAFVSAATIIGDHTSFAIPGAPAAGDMLVLAMRARDAATCSDARMTSKIATTGSAIYVGTDDGSGNPLTINLSAASVGGTDACAALMRISGTNLLPATSEATSTGSGATFTPTIPSLGSFGVIAIASGVSLVSASISDDQLGHWTTRAQVRGDPPGFASVYLGTANGLPSGQWTNPGGSPSYMAWAGGLQ